MNWNERLSATLENGQKVMNRQGNVYEVRPMESPEFKHLVNVDQSVKYENILFYKDGSHKVLTDGYVVSTIGGHFGKYPNPRDVIKIL